MILKERDDRQPADHLEAAGARAERQLAFYLRRAFGDDRDIHVFNDIRLEHRDDAAQIDHLILHPFGFVVVESKSVHDRVEIDRSGQWARWYRGRPRGMASPLNQAELQLAFLQRIFRHRTGHVMERAGRLDDRAWDVIVAISDNGLIRWQGEPDPRVCKADTVPGAVRDIAARHDGGGFVRSIFSGLTRFSLKDMDQIADFLVGNHCPRDQSPEQPAPMPHEEPVPPAREAQAHAAPASPHPEPPPAAAPFTEEPVCSRCQSTHIAVQSGPYGYYFKCGDCGGNTAIRVTCEACGRPARIRKKGDHFSAVCGTCEASRPFFVNPADEMTTAGR